MDLSGLVPWDRALLLIELSGSLEGQCWLLNLPSLLLNCSLGFSVLETLVSLNRWFVSLGAAHAVQAGRRNPTAAAIGPGFGFIHAASEDQCVTCPCASHQTQQV